MRALVSRKFAPLRQESNFLEHSRPFKAVYADTARALNMQTAGPNLGPLTHRTRRRRRQLYFVNSGPYIYITELSVYPHACALAHVHFVYGRARAHVRAKGAWCAHGWDVCVRAVFASGGELMMPRGQYGTPYSGPLCGTAKKD